MAKVNNYTQAANGTPSISINLHFDHDQSQIDFNENFERLEKQNNYYYIDNGNLTDHESIEFVLNGTIENMRKFHAEYISNNTDNFTDEDIKQDIFLSYLPDDISQLEQINGDELNTCDLYFSSSKIIDYVVIRGYSQGDYAKVFFCPADIESVWGKKHKENDLKESFSHMFFDAPIYGVIDIDGEEYFYDFDQYNFEREKWLKNVAEQAKVEYELLESLCPQQPSYE